jgi:hypothetical protein
MSVIVTEASSYPVADSSTLVLGPCCQEPPAVSSRHEKDTVEFGAILSTVTPTLRAIGAPVDVYEKSAPEPPPTVRPMPESAIHGVGSANADVEAMTDVPPTTAIADTNAAIPSPKRLRRMPLV